MQNPLRGAPSVRERDLFGHWASRWQVGNTSNAYVRRDPNSPLERALARFGAVVAARELANNEGTPLPAT